ncbi:hypothetical protein ZWY2020_029413 [Hordeum vulgare]|nr:hypothetical protein ZWY2020_029413 [Hordeum vulgare]
MPNPGSYVLVLDPTFASKRLTCRFSRVLVNDGSRINILYRDTLLKLGLEEKDLQPTSTIFLGIVPGQSCSPIGKIQLDVLFGDKAHFCREPIWFEVLDLNSPYHVLLGRPALTKFMDIPHYAYVLDLNSPYHALLGRPALTKFMDIPHYAYLKIKMPGLRGIITIAGDYKKSIECARDSSRLANALVIAEEKRQIDR